LIQKENKMLKILQRRPKPPFVYNDRLLRELPWLWSAKQVWTIYDTISVTQVRTPTFLNDWLPNKNGMPRDEGTCYVYTEEPTRRKLYTVKLEGDHLMMYDALEVLRNKGVRLETVTHVARIILGYTEVYRAASETSIEELFNQHPRTPRPGD
jgi:hypothetical protein